ncbi:PQQ-binding-like beta-propeller repeat protein [Verrucomicrobiales bacterium]|nr:PQQ-binding-like beta-propeller repeat protein [Verrucomicrobiales bacterium]
MRGIKNFNIASLVVFAFVFSVSSAKADWLNFRGPQGSGYAENIANTPAELGEAQVAWKAPLPGRGLGSAIIVGEKVFVTAASGPDQNQLHILCFNAADGAPMWERRFWATGRTMTNNKTCVAAPTPASDGERIYALYSSNDLICVDLNGNLKWMRGLTLDYPNASNSLGMASSLIISENTLIAQIENDSESFAAGFDLTDGTNKWKMDRPKAANWTSPTLLKIGDQEVVALQSSKGILGLLPATGSSVFNYEKGAATIPSGAAAGDKLYTPSNGLTAISATTDGSAPVELWNESAQRPGTASPIVIGENVYTINGAGVLSCADRQTGERLWRSRLTGPFSASPVAGANGLIYVVSETGVVQVIDPSSAEDKKVTSEYELSETILGTPSLSDGAIYVRSDKHLWKLGK